MWLPLLQLAALLQKNFIIFKRSKKTAALQILLPACMILLLFFIQIVSNEDEDLHPASIDIGSIPECLVLDNENGKYGYGERIPDADCSSVVYCPSGVIEIQDIMSRVAINQGMTFGSELYTSDIVGFSSCDDMRNFTIDHPGRTMYAVYFTDNSGGATNLGNEIKYEVQFNQTLATNFFLARYNRDNVFQEYSFSGMVLYLQTAIDRAILMVRGERVLTMDAEDFDLGHRLKLYPKLEHKSDVGKSDVITQYGGFFFFVAVMINFTIVVNQLVGEKENNQLSSMRMVGMSDPMYWLSWWLVYIVILGAANIVLVLVGNLCRMNLFVYSDFLPLFAVFFLYSWAMNSIGVVVAAIIPRARIANYVGFFLFILGIFAQILLGIQGFSYLFYDHSLIPSWGQTLAHYYPPIGFSKAITDMTQLTLPTTEWDAEAQVEVESPPVGYTWNDLFGNDLYERTDQSCVADNDPSCTFSTPPTAEELKWFLVASLVYLCVGWLYAQLVPGNGSAGRKPWFLFDPRTYFNLKGKPPKILSGAELEEEMKSFENDEVDVCAEARRVLSGQVRDEDHIMIRNLTKDFREWPIPNNLGSLNKAFRAVDGLTFSMKAGSVFCLLGHNGAGKTTALNMLTGFLRVTRGAANVGDLDVRRELARFRRMVGVCPQHTVYWPEISGREHLVLFSKLKGYRGEQAVKDADKYLKEVKLEDAGDRPVAGYSGGMKRRLAVAMALVGNPRVVLMDEPSTGMDPLSRKVIWDLVLKEKHGRFLVLTTHSMEEADYLGDTIGIMSRGRFVALGTPLGLKTKFGSGYQITVVASGVLYTNKVLHFVAKHLPAARLLDQSALNCTYALPGESIGQFPAFCRQLESDPEMKVAVEDFVLNNSSLEEVFLALVKIAEAGKNEDDSDNDSEAEDRTEVDRASLEGPPRELMRQLSLMTSRSTASLKTAQSSQLAAAGVTAAQIADEPTEMTDFTAMSDGAAKEDAISQRGQELLKRAASVARMKGRRTYQTRALVRKTATFYSRQHKSNLIQLILPVLFILCIWSIEFPLVGLIQDAIADMNDSIKEDALRGCQKCLGTFNLTEGTDPIFYLVTPTEINNTLNECASDWQDGQCLSSLINEDTIGHFIFFGIECFNYGDSCYNAFPYIGDLLVEADTDWSESGRLSGSEWPGVKNYAYVPRDANGNVDMDFVGALQGEKIGMDATCAMSHEEDGSFSVKTDVESQWVYGNMTADWEGSAAYAAQAGLLGNFTSQVYQYENATCRIDTVNCTALCTADPLQSDCSYCEDICGDYNCGYFAGPNFVRTDRNGGVLADAYAVDDDIYARQRQIYAIQADNRYSYREAQLAHDEIEKLLPPMAVIIDEAEDTDSSKKFAYTLQTMTTQNRGTVDWYWSYVWLYAELREDLKNQEECDMFSDELCEYEQVANDFMNLWDKTVMNSVSGLNYMICELDSATLRTMVDKDMSIKTGFRPLPYVANPAFSVNFASLMGFFAVLIIPMAYAMLIPMFVHHLVKEKTEKLTSMMSMMGINTSHFWKVTYIFDVVMMIILMSWIVGIGYMLNLSFFVKTSVATHAVILLCWSFAAPAFSFLLSTIYNSVRVATLSLYSGIVVVTLVAMIFNLQTDGQNIPVWMIPFAPLVFNRIVTYLSFRGYTVGELWETEVSTLLIYLLLHAAVYMLFAVYLDAVLPKPWGTSEHWLFPIHWMRWKLQGGLFTAESFTVSDKTFADDEEDVAAERRLMKEGKVALGAPVRVFNLQKRFGKEVLAVQDLVFHIDEDECFGLLGPNGAGKTTVISMLTGLFGPTAGTAKINGFSMRKEMHKIHKCIGICPQFDVLWPELTVEETFLFFARSKGVLQEDEQEAVRAIGEMVYLSSHLNKRVGDLSGGMKRRVSLGVALIGDPDVVFLDEPTTGLDPETRRLIWRTISEAKQGRVIVLTTHSMTEADALCGRIGIMAKGRLRCLGTRLHLKNKYGDGYCLKIGYSDFEKANSFVLEVAPLAKLVPGSRDDDAGKAEFQIDRENADVARIFDMFIQRDPSATAIVDFSLEHTSLEQVFLRIARESETEVPGS